MIQEVLTAAQHVVTGDLGGATARKVGVCRKGPAVEFVVHLKAAHHQRNDQQAGSDRGRTRLVIREL